MVDLFSSDRFSIAEMSRFSDSTSNASATLRPDAKNEVNIAKNIPNDLNMVRLL